MATRELVKVTRKSIDAFYARMTVGTVVECLENTYIKARVGVRGTVSQPGKTAISLKAAGVDGYRMSLPERVSDVLELTEDTIRYKLASREGHTVTWRIVAE